MTVLHGFELLKDQIIPELNSRARLYRHIVTGAQLLSLENNDENKAFGIAFHTPPPDSTGLPHIMEHSVLCGSRKYPVKEPFVELMKSSLQTFLNAMTAFDKTMYPVASQNVQDFYNLVDVYLDAVFYPRLTPQVLQQEGWHYELEQADGPLTYKGVVFNEMKGAYSSPDNLVERYSKSALFPDTAYANDSGGDPTVIPNLTFAQFKAYHETYYHPSNALLFFWGDDDPETRLKLAQGYLQDFSAHPVEGVIAYQPPFAEPRHVSYPYPAGADAASQKAYVTVNWALTENTDPTLTLGMGILAELLVGIPASPLRKALIDSGLGENLIGVGLDEDVRQMYFSTGLKGVPPEHVARVEALILETLQRLADGGLEAEMLEAALNTFEFRLREQNFGAYPRGLVAFWRALSAWAANDLLAPLAFAAPLAAVKAAVAARGCAYFADLIRAYLLENPHRVTVTLEPDAHLMKKLDAEEAARLAAVRATLSATQVQEIQTAAQELRVRQETPDSPEALATIPRLTLQDLDPRAKTIPTARETLQGVPVLHHDLPTNGICYFDLGFNLRALPPDLLPYALLFTAALLEIGTEREDFVRLTQRIARQTGGITADLLSQTRCNSTEPVVWAFLRGKATLEQADALFAILRDVLLTVRLDNRQRFLQMLLERKAREEAGLAPAGHRVALYRLRSRFTAADWATEQLSGVSALFLLRRLITQTESDWPAVLEKLEAVRRLLVNREALLCNLTLDAAGWETVCPRLEAFLAELPQASFTPAAWSPAEAATSEGLAIPAQVNYVAQGAPLYALGYRLHGSIEVILNYLRATWLWEKVRVQGGAYGGLCVFNPYSGILGYVSYRDPNLLETLDIYARTPDFLRTLALSDDERVKSIIGAIGTLDAYQLPDARGYTALTRILVGQEDAARQQYRDELLATTLDDFRAFAEVLQALTPAAPVVVVGAAEALTKAQPALNLAITPVL